jgi:hypothetical protein
VGFDGVAADFRPADLRPDLMSTTVAISAGPAADVAAPRLAPPRVALVPAAFRRAPFAPEALVRATSISATSDPPTFAWATFDPPALAAAILAPRALLPEAPATTATPDLFAPTAFATRDPVAWAPIRFTAVAVVPPDAAPPTAFVAAALPTADFAAAPPAAAFAAALADLAVPTADFAAALPAAAFAAGPADFAMPTADFAAALPAAALTAAPTDFVPTTAAFGIAPPGFATTPASFVLAAGFAPTAVGFRLLAAGDDDGDGDGEPAADRCAITHSAALRLRLLEGTPAAPPRTAPAVAPARDGPFAEPAAPSGAALRARDPVTGSFPAPARGGVPERFVAFVGLMGVFRAAGIRVFLLANDCGHVSARRLRDPAWTLKAGERC